MEIKTFPLAAAVEMKADAGDPPGTFEAVVAIFGNVDRYGDRMVKGAFARTLSENGPPAVVWSHQWETPPIGETLAAQETDEGLLIKARLLVGEDEDHAVARQVYAAMKTGALRQFSFAYTVNRAVDVTEDGETVRELHDVDLIEVGPCLRGVNPATRLLAVKAAEQEQTPPATGATPPSEETPTPPAPEVSRLLIAQPYHRTPQEDAR